MNRTDFDELADKLRNWGRWGTDDSRGTLNHIDGAAMLRGAQSATAGKLFSLSLEFNRDGLQLPRSGRLNPQLYVTAMDKVLAPANPASRHNDDHVTMGLQSATHWDSLSHVHYDGELYNGHKACDVLTVEGTKAHGVEHLANPGILSRGVLLDIARLRGVEMLSDTDEITPDDLNAAIDAQGVTISPGDILVIRTGNMRRLVVYKDRELFNQHHPGLTVACAEWLHDHSIAAVAADNQAVEVIKAETFEGEMALPMHQLCLRDMGMPFGENWNLEALAADCASDGKFTFLLCAPPIGFTGAVGAPVNPTALK